MYCMFCSGLLCPVPGRRFDEGEGSSGEHGQRLECESEGAKETVCHHESQCIRYLPQ